MTRIDTVPEHFDTEDILDDLPPGSIVRRVDDGMPFIKAHTIQPDGSQLWDRPGRRGGTDPSYITPFTLLFVPGRDLVQEAFTQGVHSGLNHAVTLATDEARGVPFDHEHDQAIVAAWIDELRDDLTKEPA